MCTQTPVDPMTMGVGKVVGTVPDAIDASTVPVGHTPATGAPSNITTTVAVAPDGRTSPNTIPVTLTHSNVPCGNVVPPGPPGIAPWSWRSRSNNKLYALRGAVSDRSKAVPTEHPPGIGVDVEVGVRIQFFKFIINVVKNMRVVNVKS